jgi:prepilin-type N-terminal cleavage/methylation domain-containing protein
MKQRRHSQSGVTLIELLIAVSLVSLLSLGMLMAIRVGLNAMQKVNTRFTANRKVTSVQHIIESQISGLIPVVSTCRGGGMGRFVYFQGLPQRMTFVSTYSLEESSRGFPRILEYSVIRGERGLRLIVNEIVYPGPVNAGFLCTGLNNGIPQFAAAGVSPRSFVLADNLAYVHFIYRQTVLPPELQKWTDTWTVPDFVPSGVRIEMAPLLADSSRLQVSTVSVPVHLSKFVLGPYADD